MLVQKTIKAKVIDPTNRKLELLEKEYPLSWGCFDTAHNSGLDLRIS